MIDWLAGWFLSRTIGNSLHISTQSNFVCCCLYFVGMNKLACHLNYWFLKWGRWGRSAMLFGVNVLLLLEPRPKFDAGFPDVISYMESWFCMNDVTSHLFFVFKWILREIRCVSVVRYCNLKKLWNHSSLRTQAHGILLDHLGIDTPYFFYDMVNNCLRIWHRTIEESEEKLV